MYVMYCVAPLHLQNLCFPRFFPCVSICLLYLPWYISLVFFLCMVRPYEYLLIYFWCYLCIPLVSNKLADLSGICTCASPLYLIVNPSGIYILHVYPSGLYMCIPLVSTCVLCTPLVSTCVSLWYLHVFCAPLWSLHVYPSGIYMCTMVSTCVSLWYLHVYPSDIYLCLRLVSLTAAVWSLLESAVDSSLLGTPCRHYIFSVEQTIV
jgi:hypothetical protein